MNKFETVTPGKGKYSRKFKKYKHWKIGNY